jgi:hypothetical protein
MTPARSHLRWSDECARILALITDHLEEALPPEWHLRFEAHLAGCPGCSGHLEQINATIRVLGHLTADGIPGEALRKLCEAFLGSGSPPAPESRQ